MNWRGFLSEDMREERVNMIAADPGASSIYHDARERGRNNLDILSQDVLLFIIDCCIFFTPISFYTKLLYIIINTVLRCHSYKYN